MKFSCERQALAAGVAVVERAVGSSDPIPEMSGIFVEAQGGRLRLAATDLELGIEYILPAQVEEEGRTVLEARFLGQLVRKVEGETVSCRLAPEGVVIQGGRARFTVRPLDPERFPELPQVQDEDEWRVGQAVLRQMIRQTVFAAANDEARPFMSGVYTEVEGDVLRMVATDASRLAYRTAVLGEPVGKASHAIIPTRALTELLRVLDPEDPSPATVTLNESYAAFLLPGVRLVTRLREGQFPNYRAVLPKEQPIRVPVPRGPFLDAIERAALVVRKGPAFVRLALEPGLLTLRVKDPELGEAVEELEVEYTGPEQAVGFQARYLVDMLKAVDSETVILELSDSRRPGSLRPADDESYLYVVMPAILD